MERFWTRFALVAVALLLATVFLLWLYIFLCELSAQRKGALMPSLRQEVHELLRLFCHPRHSMHPCGKKRLGSSSSTLGSQCFILV